MLNISIAWKIFQVWLPQKGSLFERRIPQCPTPGGLNQKFLSNLNSKVEITFHTGQGTLV
jgi:hypothetical protein